MRFAELDAVTIDGYGTLVRLRRPGARVTSGPRAARGRARARGGRPRVRKGDRVLPGAFVRGPRRRDPLRAEATLRGDHPRRAPVRARARGVRGRLRRRDPVRAAARRESGARRPTPPRPRGRGRLELGLRPAAAPGGPGPRRRARRDVGRGLGRRSRTRPSSRTRSNSWPSGPSARCTSATATRTSKAREPPACISPTRRSARRSRRSDEDAQPEARRLDLARRRARAPELREPLLVRKTADRTRSTATTRRSAGSSSTGSRSRSCSGSPAA